MASGPDDLDETPGSALDDVAANALRSAWRSSPGIFLSLVFHGFLLALLPFIIFSEQIRETLGIPVTIGLNARRVDPERPYRPLESGPPAAEGRGLDEPPVFLNDGLVAERNESRGGDRAGDRGGDTQEDALARLEGDAPAGGFRGRLSSGPPGGNDILGVGGGSGSGRLRFGARLGHSGRANLVATGGGSGDTEDAVERGLSWLARHQSPDGAWRSSGRCACTHEQESTEVAATALAVLALMTAGYGPESRVEIHDRVTGRKLLYGETVRAGLAFIVKKQHDRDRIATRDGNAAIYEHAFATMALCEAFRMTGQPAWEDRATRALDYLFRAQNTGSGWQYKPGDGKSDTSVTGAVVQALRAAQLAKLRVPSSVTDAVASFIDDVSLRDGTAGYTGRHRVSGACTAIALYTKHFLDPSGMIKDETRPRGAQKIAELVGNGQFGRDTYFWYYAMLALFEQEGPRGASWKQVNAAVTTALVGSQARRGGQCLEGSWDPAGDPTICERPVVTALSILTLETYYRYADPSLRSSESEPPPTAQPSSTVTPR